MKCCHLDLLGLSETRRTGSGQYKLATGQLLLFLDQEEANAPHSQEVDLMLMKMDEDWIRGTWPTYSHGLLPYNEQEDQ